MWPTEWKAALVLETDWPWGWARLSNILHKSGQGGSFCCPLHAWHLPSNKETVLLEETQNSTLKTLLPADYINSLCCICLNIHVWWKLHCWEAFTENPCGNGENYEWKFCIYSGKSFTICAHKYINFSVFTVSSSSTTVKGGVEGSNKTSSY